MFRRFSVDLAVFSIFVDGALITLSLWVATLVRPLFNQLPFVKEINQVTHLPVWIYFLFSGLWVLILMVFSVYDGRKNSRPGNLRMRLTSGSLLAMVALAGVLYLSLRDVSRLLFFIFFFLAYFLLILERLILFAIVRRKWFSANSSRKILVAGAGLVGIQVQEQINRFPALGLTFAGFLDDDPQKRGQPGILGSLDEVREIVNQCGVDDVVVALPTKAYARMQKLVAELHDMPVKVWVIPDYFSLALHQASVEEFAGLPMIDLRAPALTEYQRMVKRVFDVVVSVLMMPFLLIIMGIIAIAIRLDSPGPALFRQKRMGENGRVFEMVKFRTMVANAEQLRSTVERIDDDGNLIHKMYDDPRVTRVGRWLRRTSIDELPQVFNVLRGEMSLVGPRPELPYLVEKYQSWQRKRFAVPQGITGWWQVNGRSDKPMHLHTEDDIYYVQNCSIWLDIVILWKTVKAVVSRKGAF